VVTVEAGDRVRDLVLVDIKTGETYRRAVGSNGDKDRTVGPDDPACEALGPSPTCGATSPPTTAATQAGEDDGPVAAMRDYVDAIKSNDCGRFLDRLSAASRVAMQMPSRDVALSQCNEFSFDSSEFAGLTLVSVDLVSREGDHATVHAVSTDLSGKIEETITMVREDGMWRLNLLDSE